MVCKLDKGKIKPCKGLDGVLEQDGGVGTRKQGAKLQTLINFKTGKFSRQWVALKSGEHSKMGIVMNYCPFCGEQIFREEQSSEPK